MKYLKYWKSKVTKEDYLNTPNSVIRYLSALENTIKEEEDKKCNGECLWLSNTFDAMGFCTTEYCDECGKVRDF